MTALESGATVEFDPETLNPRFSYADERERTHRVWITDAVTAWNQVRAADAAGAPRAPRCGGSAPRTRRCGRSSAAAWRGSTRQKLADLPPGYDLVLEGDGDIWRILSTPEPGRREVRSDPATGLIVGETYERLPMPYRIDQIGARKGQILLSFDDGPDARYTPQILDVLKSRGAPAAFFVTGISANAQIGLLQREYREGHEIGNHSYTHPHFDRISRAQLLVEINLTARLFESVLGARTLLFRPPYGIDHQPEDPEEVALLPVPQSMGYIIVGSRIDPHDWGEPGGGRPPAPEELVRRVLAAARRGAGNIVLLHDGGGDRCGDRGRAARDHRRAAGPGLRAGVGLAAARPHARADDAPPHPVAALAGAGRPARCSTSTTGPASGWPPSSSPASPW